MYVQNMHNVKGKVVFYPAKISSVNAHVSLEGEFYRVYQSPEGGHLDPDRS